MGLLRELNPGPRATEARIMPLDQAAKCLQSYTAKLKGTQEHCGCADSSASLIWNSCCRAAGRVQLASVLHTFVFAIICFIVDVLARVLLCVVVLLCCVCCVVCCVCVCCLSVRRAFVLFALGRPLKNIGAGATSPPQERRLHLA
jgi:hypothetical protein